MHVLGGTYGERCANPVRDELFGSGLRAASALSVLCPAVRLTSAVNSDPSGSAARAAEAEAAGFVAKSLGVDARWVERSRPMSWSYFTPLAAPTLNGAGAVIDSEIAVDDVAVLVFGLVEAGPGDRARPQVKGRRVVLDPQKPRDLTLSDVAEISAESVLLVLNEDETRALGRSLDVEDAARNLLSFQHLPVEAVITKRGARGALVTMAGASNTVISPRWTPRVYPIGSGDVFAATAAWAWAEQGHDPVTAANIASAATAWYCQQREVPVPLHAVDSSPYAQVHVDHDAAVYLAGPFFNLAQRWLVDLVEYALRPSRFSPMHDVGPGDVDVAELDLAGLGRCSSMLALLDGSDPGTVFEAGYATKQAMPVVCFAEQVDAEGYKMLAGTGAEITDDLTTAVYHSIWAAMDPDTWRGRNW